MPSASTSYYTGTNSTATYTYGTSEEKKSVASIRRTKHPANEWSDVIEVSIAGTHYAIGDIVRIVSGSRDKFGRVEGFKPSTVKLATIDGYCKFYYGEITPTKQGDKPDIKPDPNRAFLTRKKEIL